MPTKFVLFMFLLFSLGTASAQSIDFNAVKRAATGGDVEAQLGLGLAYDLGDGLPRDGAQAIYWYRKAAEQGNQDAQMLLGYAYHEGKSVPKDSATSAMWHQMAAQQGSINSQVALAGYYALGEGVPKNYVLSYAWANLAASKDNKDAIEFRDMLEKEMTPGQIAEAQSLSSRWRPGRPIQ